MSVRVGAAAEHHDSNMVPMTRPRSQISDDGRMVPADIFALLWALHGGSGGMSTPTGMNWVGWCRHENAGIELV